MTSLNERTQFTPFHLYLHLVTEGPLIWVKSRGPTSHHFLTWKIDIQLKSYKIRLKTHNTASSSWRLHWLTSHESWCKSYGYFANIILRFCAAIVITRLQRKNKTTTTTNLSLFWLHQKSQTEKLWAREDLKQHWLTITTSSTALFGRLRLDNLNPGQITTDTPAKR